MSLTLSDGPLAPRSPASVNYRLDGPQHKLLLHPFPRRVRAVLGTEAVLDTERGALLHETAILPQLYVPLEDVRMERLEPTEHRTRCPFKGDASYWTVRAGERGAENAAWAYPTPKPEADWLRGLVAFYWESLDAWFDEDEEVEGHLRDPYHRVDVRQSSRHVRVSAGGAVVAESRRALVLSETGLPNRWYLPPQDVRTDLLGPSATHSICAYKGRASYRTLCVDGARIPDAAWVYPEPLDGVRRIEGHVCFLGDGIGVEVDGRPAG